MEILPALQRQFGLHFCIPFSQLSQRDELLLSPLVNDGHQHGERIIFSGVLHLPLAEGFECMREFPVDQELKRIVGPSATQPKGNHDIIR